MDDEQTNMQEFQNETMTDKGGKLPLERTSSFARSFYRGAEKSEEGGSSFPVPRSRPMGRRQSSRPRNSLNAALSAAAAADADGGLRDGEPGDVAYGGSPANVDRANSWYVDALRQQGGTAANLDEILGANGNEGEGFDDTEVLEQYRIMAQHEANLRVKENTGFDMAEYEKRRKLHGDEPKDKKGLYGGGKKPKTRLPEPRKVSSSSSTARPEEPSLPRPKFSPVFVQQKVSRVEELCPGVSVRGASNIPTDEHVVRCIACRGQLRVKVLATLVSCPECNTVSPASSTRR